MGAHRRRMQRRRLAARQARDNGSPESESAGSPRPVSEPDLGNTGRCQFDADETSVPSAVASGTARDGRGLGTGSAINTSKHKYNPRDPYARLAGYCGSLTPDQEAALGAVRQWLTRGSIDLSPLLGGGKYAVEDSCFPPEDKDLALLRFLRRNSFDVKQTCSQVERNLAWRSEKDITACLRREPWEVAGCKDAETFDALCHTYYPHYTLGGDRLGRPVLVQKYGNFDTAKLQKCTTMEGLLLYHAWEQEKNAELLRRATVRTGYLVETYTVIMDFKDMGIGLISKDFLWLLRELSDMDRTYYPGRGGVTYVINTPPLFGLVWGGIRSFMDTQAQIHILGKEEEWKAALAEAIDPRQLPVEYGGCASPLAKTPFLPAVHRALDKETSVGGRSVDDFVGTAASSDMVLSSPPPVARCAGAEGSSGFSSDSGFSSETPGSHVNHGNNGFVNGHAVDPNLGVRDWGRSRLSWIGRSSMRGRLKVIDKKACDAFRLQHGLCIEGKSKSEARTKGGTVGSNSDSSSHRNGEKGCGGGVRRLKVIDYKACEAFRLRHGLCIEGKSKSRVRTNGGTVGGISDSSSHRNGEKGCGGRETSEQERKGDGVWGWLLDVVPGARLAAGMAESVAGATWGACGCNWRVYGLSGN